MSRNRWMLLGLGLIVLGVVAWVTLVLVIWEVTPGPEAVVSEAQPLIEVQYLGFPVGARVLVDRRAAPAGLRRGESKLVARPHPLDEGTHTVSVELRTLLGRTARTMWQIRVDRRPPSLQVDLPLIQAESELKVVGRTDGLTVTVAGQETKPDSSGRFEATVTLSEGVNPIEIVAFDEAGNPARVVKEVVHDPHPPELELLAPDVLKQPEATLRIRVRDQSDTELSLTLDARRPIDLEEASEDPSPDRADRPEQPGGPREFSARLADLPEGTRTLELSARDQAGNETKETVTVLVDSTETFGERLTTVGAVGEDVSELQQRLSGLGFLAKEEVTGRFDETTLQAILSCQKKHGLQTDGVVGPNLVAVLGPRISINLARFSLVVEDPVGKTRRYSIAHGLPEHPTPTGEFWIVEKIKDPTWIPPDSPWAREAKATPPGPENPLGTRWLGLNSNLVGIHGTPFAWSIGTRASHGCIRMHIEDVEALFEHVGVGTAVHIYSGSEDDPRVTRLWP